MIAARPAEIPSPTPEAPPRWRWTAALGATAASTAIVVAATATAGYGWDWHWFRLAATAVLSFGPALVATARGNTPMARYVAATLGLVLAACGWWFVPAYPGGPDLWTAAQQRRYLLRQFEQIVFDDLRLVHVRQRTIDQLTADFPSLAQPLQQQRERWTQQLLDMVAHRYSQFTANDLSGERQLHLRLQQSVHALPELEAPIARIRQQWQERILQELVDELRRLPPDDWEGFRRTSGKRQTFARSWPDCRPQLIASEQQWVEQAVHTVIRSAESQLPQQPRAAREMCSQTRRELRSLRWLHAAAEPQLLYGRELFNCAQRAAATEIMGLLQAQQYLYAYGVARTHALEWLPLADQLGPTERQRVESLRDTTRFLALLAERLPATAPPPREIPPPEPAPAPRDLNGPPG